MWLLEITIIYQTKCGEFVKKESLDGFMSEKACVKHIAIEDKHLKRIKAQTNITNYELNCYNTEVK